jgi:trehalose 6-phosphate synthase
VAAQSSTDPGVLILSRFAGAAQELDSALLVNPYDTDAVAAAMLRALNMPIEERQERWAAMMARIEENTVDHWCASFVDALANPAWVPPVREPIAVSLEPEVRTATPPPPRPAAGEPAVGPRIVKN